MCFQYVNKMPTITYTWMSRDVKRMRGFNIDTPDSTFRQSHGTLLIAPLVFSNVYLLLDPPHNNNKGWKCIHMFLFVS